MATRIKELELDIERLEGLVLSENKLRVAAEVEVITLREQVRQYEVLARQVNQILSGSLPEVNQIMKQIEAMKQEEALKKALRSATS